MWFLLERSRIERGRTGRKVRTGAAISFRFLSFLSLGIPSGQLHPLRTASLPLQYRLRVTTSGAAKITTSMLRSGFLQSLCVSLLVSYREKNSEAQTYQVSTAIGREAAPFRPKESLPRRAASIAASVCDGGRLSSTSRLRILLTFCSNSLSNTSVRAVLPGSGFCSFFCIDTPWFGRVPSTASLDFLLGSSLATVGMDR